MIVVADTSVILNLACIGRENLLMELFDVVVVPPVVRDEFLRLESVDCRFAGLVLPGSIRVQAPKEMPEAILKDPDLDKGEAAALALALELRVAAVLIDEAAGRAAAKQLGLRAIGILGILLEARAKSILPAVAPVLEELLNVANFWISPALKTHVLTLAGEKP